MSCSIHSRSQKVRIYFEYRLFEIPDLTIFINTRITATAFHILFPKYYIGFEKPHKDKLNKHFFARELWQNRHLALTLPDRKTVIFERESPAPNIWRFMDVSSRVCNLQNMQTDAFNVQSNFQKEEGSQLRPCILFITIIMTGSSLTV